MRWGDYMVPKFSSACTWEIYTALWSTQRDLKGQSTLGQLKSRLTSVPHRIRPRTLGSSTALSYHRLILHIHSPILNLLPSYNMPHHNAAAFTILHCSHFYRATPSDIIQCRHKSTFLLHICLQFLTWESAAPSTQHPAPSTAIGRLAATM